MRNAQISNARKVYFIIFKFQANYSIIHKIFLCLLNTRVKYHIALSPTVVSSCHLPSETQIFENYLAFLYFWFRTSQKCQNVFAYSTKKTVPKYKPFMIKSSFDVVRILSSCHLVILSSCHHVIMSSCHLVIFVWVLEEVNSKTLF
jgi:hypothetical protein